MAERLPSAKSMLRSLSEDESSERKQVSAASSRDEEIEETLQKIQKQGKYVKMNVGGVLYCTTLGTLTKHDNMLRAMFSERIPLQRDEEGWVIVDRSGKHFGSILNFIRDDFIPLPDNRAECMEILAEAKYFCIAELVEELEEQLERLRDDYHKICRVPVITSLEEETRIVSTSMKPVIKLLYNRGNNKYSYTTNSDDNLLKNIELFDKLSVRFGQRIKFIKDIVGRGEICCWAFYGHAKKIAEVCCESIVYATDRKHTKIEFPEAKILDETLNIMLYEKRAEGGSPLGYCDPLARIPKAPPPRPPGTPDGVLSEDELR